MNLFGFGKKKKEEVPLKEAISRLKKAAEDSQKRETFLEHEREKARQEGAAKLKAKDKKGAMFYLKRMRAFEKELQSLYGKRSNLDTLVLSLESASFDRSLIEAMSAGHKATQSIARDEEVDKVQDMVAELQESMQAIDEMSTSLAEPISNEFIDEDELLTAFEESHVTEKVADLVAEPKPVETKETKVRETVSTEAANKVAEEVSALPEAPRAEPQKKVTETTTASGSSTEDELSRIKNLMSL